MQYNIHSNVYNINIYFLKRNDYNHIEYKYMYM